MCYALGMTKADIARAERAEKAKDPNWKCKTKDPDYARKYYLSRAAPGKPRKPRRATGTPPIAENPKREPNLDPDHHAKRKLKARLGNRASYGVDLDTFMLWDNACKTGSCNICGMLAKDSPKQMLHKDHTHTDPPIPRGCLCFNCNSALGKLRDSPDLLRKAAEYLEARDPRYAKVEPR
jgi:hypothetical protein